MSADLDREVELTATILAGGYIKQKVITDVAEASHGAVLLAHDGRVVQLVRIGRLLRFNQFGWQGETFVTITPERPATVLHEGPVK
jgi:hypothetical protein